MDHYSYKILKFQGKQYNINSKEMKIKDMCCNQEKVIYKKNNFKVMKRSYLKIQYQKKITKYRSMLFLREEYLYQCILILAEEKKEFKVWRSNKT